MEPSQQRSRRCAALGRFVPALWTVLLLLLHAALAQAQRGCATMCYELDCDTPSGRYGKYCGMGHTGCPQEEPCDAVDACCQRHDACTAELGMLNAASCHTAFLGCLDRAELSGSSGFSDKCPPDVVVPALRKGVELSEAFTSIFGKSIQKAKEQMAADA